MLNNPNATARHRMRRRQETWLFALAFMLVLSLGLATSVASGDLRLPPNVIEGLGLVVLALCVLAPAGVHRFVWHLLANRIGVAKPLALAQPRVIDGDTIDDLATGVRYRLANIDSPETGDNAKCFKERERGEAATVAADQIVRGARRVEVRQTLRIDLYGRRVAFVMVDGEDLGQLLVRRGLARPWRGTRERWCGRNGGLSKIARQGLAGHKCSVCRNWS